MCYPTFRMGYVKRRTLYYDARPCESQISLRLLRFILENPRGLQRVCEVIAVHGSVAETEGNVNLIHGVMKPTISVRQISTHSLR